MTADTPRPNLSEDVVRLVTEARSAILDAVGSDGLIALALVGSCARGEETWLEGSLVSDIDIVAVTSAAMAARRSERLEEVGRAIGHGVTIGCLPLYSLSRFRTVELYGAKRDGWVFWGDPDVFGRVRVNGPDDIPRWEAPRLALNRAMDFLRADAGLVAPWYATAKMYLALGEAALILDGSYEPSYRRQQLLYSTRAALLAEQDLRDLFLAAVAAKFDTGRREIFSDSPEAHRARAVKGLAALFSRYLGRDVGVLEGLKVLSRAHFSAPHRAMYVARNFRRPSRWSRAMASDPAFWFWEVAVEVLVRDRAMGSAELVELLADFDHTQQPLPR